MKSSLLLVCVLISALVLAALGSARAAGPSFGPGEDGTYGVAGFTLAHALWSKSDTNDNLCTLSFVDGAQGLALNRYEASSINESLAMARKHLRELFGSGAKRATIAYDGNVLMSGQRIDAIILEIHTAGSDSVVTIAQRYHRVGSKEGFGAIWPPLRIERSGALTPLIKSAEQWLLSGVKAHPKAASVLH